MKTVIVFGNPDLPTDSLPVRIMPALMKKRPDLDIRHLDPNEEWEVPAEISVIDTVAGLKEPRLFAGLDEFTDSGPRVSMHDFDAYTNLKLMMKLGKIRAVRVIGLPPELDEAVALTFCLASMPMPASGAVDRSR
jgi:hypothetical protein